MELIDLSFDKGNGAIFKIEFEGELVRCFVSQDNDYLNDIYQKTLREPKWNRSIQKNFIELFEGQKEIIAIAARNSVAENGVSDDVWGNLIESSYMFKVDSQHNKALKKTDKKMQALFAALIILACYFLAA